MRRARGSVFPRCQRGLGLIELMIAMTLGLIVSAVLTQVFVANGRSHAAQHELSRLQENARLALYFLARDLREAGYRGCAHGAPYNHLDVDPADSVFDRYDFARVIGGEAGAASDTLSITSSRGVAAYLAAAMPQRSASLSVTANGFSSGDVVMIGDCLSAEVFQIGGGNPTSTGVITRSSGQGSPGNRAGGHCSGSGASGHCLTRLYQPGAELVRLQRLRYEVRNDASNAGEPSLYRDAQPLIPGVEVMRVRYGEDTGGSGAVDRYVAADAVADWDAVVAVRVELLLRSGPGVAAAGARHYEVGGVPVSRDDTRLRRVVGTTVALRNRMP